MFRSLVQRTLRVPRSEGAIGDGSAVARQLDAALLSVGFSASAELLAHVSAKAPGVAIDLAADTVSAVRELVGDHVQHNSYFIDFPKNVPDTMEFWVESLRAALVPAGQKASVFEDATIRALAVSGGLNLLDLPNYGTYQHSFADLVATHDELVESAKDRVTVLHLGGTLEEETQALYVQLAGSTTPLTEGDRELLAELAAMRVDAEQPAVVPVRENRAIVNVARLNARRALVGVDTVTDVLRVAALASGGDVSLAVPARFRNFVRAERRLMLSALHQVVVSDRNKLADAHRHAEQWKRLAKALHPNDYPQFARGGEVFSVARDPHLVPSLSSRVEFAFAESDRGRAARLLSVTPGQLLRSADRLLRAADYSEHNELVELIAAAMKSASGRVLLSLREHLANRMTPDVARVFVGRSKRAFVTPDNRDLLSSAAVKRLSEAIDAELLSRLPSFEHLVIDPEVMGMALPLSGKAAEDGFSVMPRGSRTHIPVNSCDTLRFFVYWMQDRKVTDYDLSMLMLGSEFDYKGQVSWTSYHSGGVTYSGDLVNAPAPHGATEFIDVQFAQLQSDVHYFIPQVNIYTGEGFDEVAESMFGWMTRDEDQRGMPFEARTVRTRSDMRGSGRVALPMAFARTEDGGWDAIWLHLYLQGGANFNRVEANRFSTGLLAKSIINRKYLTMKYLVGLLAEKAGSARSLGTENAVVPGEAVTFIGREVPDGLPEGSEVFGPDRLSELIPG